MAGKWGGYGKAKGGKGGVTCSNSQCKRGGHTISQCWRPGGGKHDPATWQSKGEKAKKGQGKKGARKPFDKKPFKGKGSEKKVGFEDP